MVTLDFSNVLGKFSQISQCEFEGLSDVVPIVEQNIFALENLIDEDKFEERYRDKCEYAAAVCAFYDYLCREGAKERIIVTMSGTAAANEDVQKRVPYAEDMKDRALNAVSAVLKDKEFIFRSV